MIIVLKVTKSLLHLFCRISVILRPFVAFCKIAWSCKVIYSPIWPFMVLDGLLLSFIVFLWSFYGLLWSFYGLLWQNIDLLGLESSFLAVIDPNSFGLINLILWFKVSSLSFWNKFIRMYPNYFSAMKKTNVRQHSVHCKAISVSCKHFMISKSYFWSQN